MSKGADLLIRNGYLPERDGEYDLAVADGEVVAIDTALDRSGTREIDADGNVVAPGFVDSHLHVDKAYSADGDRTPRFNDRGLDLSRLRERSQNHYRNTSKVELTENAVRLCSRAVEHGTLFVRAHVNVGTGFGTKVVESVLRAREQLDGILDMQVVLFPDAGILNDESAESLLAESLAMGADLVGGADPATKNGDIGATLDAWFDVATAHDAGIDVHLHSPDTLSVYELLRLADETAARSYGGRVTASHSFGLADVAGREPGDIAEPEHHPHDLKAFPQGELDAVIDRVADAGLKITSSYHNVRPGMPFRALSAADVPVGWGSDNVCDYVVRHAQPDPLLGTYVNACKLDYNFHTFASNQGLELLWETITDGAASVLDLDGYGIREGTPADLVVLDEPSPQWAIINQAERRYVIKDGRVVVEDGSLVSEVG